MVVRLLILCGAAVFLSACQAQSVPDRFRATGEVIAFSGGKGGAANACVTCHGLKGEGDGREAPRLAGLDAGYLHRQLDDYASGRRDHKMMREVTLRLDGEDRAKVSSYYASLPAPPAPAAAAAVSKIGDDVYFRGDPARGLQPCAVCHGASGEGIGPGNPPLAGQSADYLERQLVAWRDSDRRGDGMNEMLAISRRLAPDELRPVAVRAAALPGLRPPEAPAASPEARHADPRNGASAPPRRASAP